LSELENEKPACCIALPAFVRSAVVLSVGCLTAFPGTHNYVFKQGMVYRGESAVNESGTSATSSRRA